MKKIMFNITTYISNLSAIDIVFFCILMILLILIISLIHVMKNNQYAHIIEEYEKNRDKQKKEEPKQIEALELNINEEPKIEIQEEIKKEDKEDSLDLKALTKMLEEKESEVINLTPYEEEQEEKAIISYDELVKSRNNFVINYESEKEEDGILVKKVDLNNLTSILEQEAEQSSDTKTSVSIGYEREEAFLDTLKQLQQLLNN